MDDRPDDRTSAKVAKEILRRIARLDLAPGTTVTERELSVELGQGKAIVREALLQLTHTGLLWARSGSGYLVEPITMRDLRSLFQLWRIFEGGAAALIATRGLSPEYSEQFKTGKYATHAFEFSEGEAGEELAFHRLLMVATQNAPFVMSQLAVFDTKIERLLRFASSLGADLGAFQQEHGHLIEILRKGDPDSARKAAEQHIGRIENVVVSALLSSKKIEEMNLAEP